ncbi:hypothetical protein V6N13_137343 [Hibiscus sabdariffa]
MVSIEFKANPVLVFIYVFFLLLHGGHYCSSQRVCPSCGSMEVPYPLSTHPGCGDPSYSLRCDSPSRKLYFDAMGGSSYVVTRITASFYRMVVQPSPWLPGRCETEDMGVSEGLWLNQTLPFNITSSNTIFLLNCSPRLLVSPLNCTPSSLCHHYLESSGHVEAKRALQCADDVDPCCTFVAGGMPSSYKIRLHSSGCKAFRSIIHLDPQKAASEWEEGLEIQWEPPLEPVCKTQRDCVGTSRCSPTASNGLSRCLCNKGYNWDPVVGACLGKKKKEVSVRLKASIGVISFFTLAMVIGAITSRKPWKHNSKQTKEKEKLMKEREDMLKSSNGGKSAKIFRLKEVKKMTNDFSRDRYLGSGGFGEVYKGELPFGDTVAVKSAKVGNIKSTQQVLNEVGILSQVNHKNLGTLGYMDPEYYRNYQLTDKSDVYSYGVVLLELLTSQRAIDFSRDQDDVNLAIYVSQRASNGAIMEVVDHQLLNNEAEPSADMFKSFELFLELAFACLREKKSDRPCMKDVVQELHCIIQIIDQENVAKEVRLD